MSRRGQIQDIVSGLLGRFISRNNDVEGYWALGKLCLHAKDHRVDTLEIDLKSGTLTPPGEAFGNLLWDFKSALSKHALLRGIHADWIPSAKLEVNFKPSPPPNEHINVPGRDLPRKVWGELFKVTVSISDDRGRLYQLSRYDYCRPHCAMSDSRRGG